MEIIKILSGLLTPFIAIIAVYIGYQQYRVNRQRLSNDIYNRRLAIYILVQRFITDIIHDGEVTEERCFCFYTEVSETPFLFGSEVKHKIDALYLMGMKLNSLQKRQNTNDTITREQKKSLTNDVNAIILNFNNEFASIQDLFVDRIEVMSIG